MKKIMLALTSVLLLVLFAACSGGEQDWNGTFYQYLDEDHVLAFTFERDDASEEIQVSKAEITTDNGVSMSSVLMSAQLINENTAEDSNEYRFTLKGDTLTVKWEYTGQAEGDFGTDFSGTYTRGASVEETFDLDDVDNDDNDGTLAFAEFYYWEGDMSDESLYFRDDGKVEIDVPSEEVYEYDYTVHDGKIYIEIDGTTHTLMIIDVSLLETEGGNQYILISDAGENPDGDADSSDTDAIWAGTFTSDDGKYALYFADYNEQSFSFAFISNDGDSYGVAQVSTDNFEMAESEGLTFWFMDRDTLLVSGGAFEGTYIRNEEDLS